MRLDVASRETIKKRLQRERGAVRAGLRVYRERLRCLLHAASVDAGKSIFVVRNAAHAGETLPSMIRMAPPGSAADGMRLILPNNHTITVAWQFELRHEARGMTAEIFVDPRAEAAVAQTTDQAAAVVRAA